MFFLLLLITFLIALAVSLTVNKAFSKPLRSILDRVIADEISVAWHRYLQFAIIVVGVSSGVRIHQLERYITPMYREEGDTILALTTDRWVLELYRTVIGTLQGIAWMLLVFFIFALIAFVIVRLSEMRRDQAS
ncbi:MAG: hypothetical protein V3W14_04125 [Candidatus Neomarinimicrobiota bacterium]